MWATISDREQCWKCFCEESRIERISKLLTPGHNNIRLRSSIFMLALNELSAFKNPQTSANGGVALVPLNDDMTVINNGNTVTQSLGKTNAYRAGVGQPLAATTADASGVTYCQTLPFPASSLLTTKLLWPAKPHPCQPLLLISSLSWPNALQLPSALFLTHGKPRLRN